MVAGLEFELEKRLWNRGYRRIAGVDEVGRGCLAGPVVAAVCVLPAECDPLEGIRDSKLTRRSERSRLVETIVKQAECVSFGAASRREIDLINIRRASALAMRRALKRSAKWDYALIDGPLPPELEDVPGEGVIDGDAVSPSIACASILAKHLRDHLMELLAKVHPEYGWERNAGYGTRAHLDALARFGPTAHHRRSFKPVSQLPLSLPIDGWDGTA